MLTPQEMETAQHVLRNLQSDKYKDKNYLFLYPVDMKEVPGYMQVVEKKLDLETVTTLLLTGAYSTMSDFWDDTAAIFQNAIKYHSSKNRSTTNNQIIAHLAKEMLKVLDKERGGDICTDGKEGGAPAAGAASRKRKLVSTGAECTHKQRGCYSHGYSCIKCCPVCKELRPVAGCRHSNAGCLTHGYNCNICCTECNLKTINDSTTATSAASMTDHRKNGKLIAMEGCCHADGACHGHGYACRTCCPSCKQDPLTERVKHPVLADKRIDASRAPKPSIRPSESKVDADMPAGDNVTFVDGCKHGKNPECLTHVYSCKHCCPNCKRQDASRRKVTFAAALDSCKAHYYGCRFCCPVCIKLDPTQEATRKRSLNSATHQEEEQPNRKQPRTSGIAEIGTPVLVGDEEVVSEELGKSRDDDKSAGSRLLNSLMETLQSMTPQHFARRDKSNCDQWDLLFSRFTSMVRDVTKHFVTTESAVALMLRVVSSNLISVHGCATLRVLLSIMYKLVDLRKRTSSIRGSFEYRTLGALIHSVTPRKWILRQLQENVNGALAQRLLSDRAQAKDDLAALEQGKLLEPSIVAADSPAFQCALTLINLIDQGMPWDKCKAYIKSENAAFKCQAGVKPNWKTIKDYVTWKQYILKRPGYRYKSRVSSYDFETKTAYFSRTSFILKSLSGKITNGPEWVETDYCYFCKMSDENVVESIHMVWNHGFQ